MSYTVTWGMRVTRSAGVAPARSDSMTCLTLIRVSRMRACPQHTPGVLTIRALPFVLIGLNSLCKNRVCICSSNHTGKHLDCKGEVRRSRPDVLPAPERGEALAEPTRTGQRTRPPGHRR